ncbi:hypothetical protein WJX81_002731 [Elliptochloris bilobata]|uniref:MHD domain-containing protein n=1 Tax=Elliptochloris bilobata TaxID=381761 RepID=A0AAW1SJD8_9CHLO
MVAGFELALVLRAKGGSNFLVHSRGINAQTANEATREAASVLTRFAESGGHADTDESGDNAPSFTFGNLAVDCGRLRVVYRLVGGVLLMGVVRAGACVLRLLRLLDAVTRLLVAAARTVDVTPDKLARRYPEVYVALAVLVEAGGGDAGHALAAAEAELAALAPDAKSKSVAAKGRAMLSGSSFRSRTGGTSATQPGPAADAPAAGVRKLSAASEELGRGAAGGKARAATPDELRAVEAGRALVLRETYRGAFVGDQLTRAGTCGEVLPSGEMGRAAAEAAFRLAGPPGGPPGAKLAAAAVRAAVLAPLRARRAQSGGGGGAPGIFIASFEHADSAQAAFLQYRLPAVACTPPLLLRLSARRAARAVLLEARLAAAPGLPGALEGLVLDLEAPAALGDPSKITPRASWAPAQRRLRWHLLDLPPGGTAVARAVFTHGGTIPAPAAATAARGAGASLSFSGPPGGGTLSGVALESGDVGDEAGGGGTLAASVGMFGGRVAAQPAQG